jgi:16S rRNA (cytosine967-C5)-methyltransferase
MCFREDHLNHFTKLQRNIVVNSVSNLKQGGYFLYSTCSAFRCENEEQVQWIEKSTSLRCIKSSLVNGTECEADTMFVALFQKTGMI